MKKYLILLLIPLLVLVTACTKNEGKQLKLVDSKFGTTTFTIDDTYTDVEEEKDGASTEISFENESLDLEYEMYYNRIRKATYKSSKETRSKQKYYKEYTFGDYKGYAYGEYESGLYMNIILAEDEEDYIILFVSLDRNDNDIEKVVAEIVEEKPTQDFFKSMKFKKA